MNPALAIPALMTAVLLLASCSDDAEAGDTTTPTVSESPSGPIDIMSIPEDSPLPPGTYSLPLLQVEDAMRVVVTIPAGYYGGGGGVLTKYNPNPDEDADLAFWGRIDVVASDACFKSRNVDSGSTVRDLVSLLVAQKHRTTSRPTAVTLGGYPGFYVKATAPSDLTRCHEGVERTYAAATPDGDEPFSWLTDDLAGEVDHTWVVDVNGRRILGGIRAVGGYASDASELIDVVESAEFVTS